MQILTNILIAYGVISMIFTTVFLVGLIRNIRKEIQLIEDVDRFKKTVKLVYVEHVDGYSYMYDRITNRFICQAESDEAVLARAKELFPEHKIDVKDIKDLVKIPKEINSL